MTGCAKGPDGTSERTRTLYEGLLEPVLEGIGARPLRDLGARDVRSVLSRLATRYSIRSLQVTGTRWNGRSGMLSPTIWSAATSPPW